MGSAVRRPGCGGDLLSDLERAYIPSLLVQSPLPVRDPRRSEFVRRSGGQSLTLTGAFGIPFGHIGRTTLALAVTDAVQNKSPRVELGSIGQWIKRLDRDSHGGKGGSIGAVRDQFARIHGLYINWQAENGGRMKSFNMPVSRDMEIWWTKKEIEANVPTLFDNYLMFHPDFLEYVLKHPVPVDLAVYSSFQASQAQDIYAWLAWKLNGLERPLEIRWESLQAQFADRKPVNPREWRKRWLLHTLEVVERGYPAASIQGTDTGVKLLPSPRAIAPRAPGYLV